MINTTGNLPEGWVIDHGTSGLSNIAHSSSWTGNLLTAEAFRVAFLEKRFGKKSIEYTKAILPTKDIITKLTT